MYRYFRLLPILLGTIVVLDMAFLRLHRKFDSFFAGRGKSMVSKYRAQLTPKEIDTAGRVAIAFMLGWTVIGIVVSLVYDREHQAYLFQTTKGNLYVANDALSTFVTTPTLATVLFILSIDVAHARKIISEIAQSAQNQSLTVRQYRQAKEAVDLVFEKWQTALSVLTVVATLNAVAMVIFLGWMNSQTETTGTLVLHDSLVIADMGKEVYLLLHITISTRLVNDEADDVVTDMLTGNRNKSIEHSVSGLNEESHIEGGDISIRSSARVERLKMEARRLGIFAEGSNIAAFSPQDPEKRKSMWQRITSAKSRSIAVRVMGIRWVSTYVQALLVSSAISFIAALFVNF